MAAPDGALARLLCGIAALLLWTCPAVSAVNLAELELHARDLNATAPDDVHAFIRRWETRSRGNTRGRQYPPLASTLPSIPLPALEVAGRVRARQDDVACTWNGGGACFGDGKCCGPVDNGWCCPGSESCCQGGSSSGCCGSDGFCCGSETGFEEGNCCTRGQTCCVPNAGKPFVSEMLGFGAEVVTDMTCSVLR